MERSIDRDFQLGVRAERDAAAAGDPLERRRLLRAAWQAYDRVLARDPNDAATLNNRANVRAQLDDLAGARNDIRAALDNAPDADRAFYLRRAGDLAAVDRAFYYWKALEWNPYDSIAHQRILPYLRTAPAIQVANYFRFLLEHRRTSYLIAAATERTTDPARVGPDAVAATAEGLKQAALAVRPEELERRAAPFLERTGAAGSELRSVLRGEAAPWSWLAAHGGAAATTDRPPHASYRGLSHALGDGSALRGDLPRAERQHRLALTMPGADLSDRLALIDYLAAYGTTQQLCDAVTEEESRATTRSREEVVAFRRAAAFAFAVHGACAGPQPCSFAAQANSLYPLGGAPPAAARRFCPNVAPPPQDCLIVFGVSGRRRDDRTLLAFPADARDDEVDCSLDVIALDYDTEALLPLVIEARTADRLVAESVRERLIARGIPPEAITVVPRRQSDDRVRIRFAMPSPK